ncbi:hypothetical protein DL771_003169 [Monosporascus sp. 5C6A]|nr:hypothetical protein DL771_003169 [Monosporascus sp. 5C6A]
MPKNCSKDFSAIIGYVDAMFLHGSRKQMADLKRLFGLQNVRHGDDAAAAISAPVWAWQVSKHGVGLKKALPNYAKWYTTSYLPGYVSTRAPWLTRLSARDGHSSAANISLYWGTLGSPNGVLSPRRCPVLSTPVRAILSPPGPVHVRLNRGKTAAALNAHTKGWHLYAIKQLMWVNGEFDPWRSASMASMFRPGGPLPSTLRTPSIVIPGARHCNNLRARNAINEDVEKTQEAVIKQMAEWTNEFYGQGRGHRRLSLTGTRVR